MKLPKLNLATIVFALLSGAISASAVAENNTPFPYADELDACVSAVTEHLDLTDVRRVRHTVVQEKRTGIGYALNIETSVFSGDVERRYSSYCVATGSGTPLKFKIDQRSD